MRRQPASAVEMSVLIGLLERLRLGVCLLGAGGEIVWANEEGEQNWNACAERLRRGWREWLAEARQTSIRLIDCENETIVAGTEAAGSYRLVLLQSLTSSIGAAGGLFRLSPTESEVATMLVRGHPPREIARRLGTSVTTVRTHLSNLFAKTRTRRQAELVSRLTAVRVWPKLDGAG